MSASAETATEIRIGQFPNVTHAQALMARASGDYEKALGIPEGVEPVAMTPLGKAANAPAPKKRKELKDILHQEKW